jgi:Ca2+/Na+ antiporter
VLIDTSLPEFTISIMVVLRQHMDVEVGNIVGVFSLISPIAFKGRLSNFDQWALLSITVILTTFYCLAILSVNEISFLAVVLSVLCWVWLLLT